MNNNEGLTKLYNRFHDPEERSKEILRLRALHDELDRSVLAAYGWSDIGLECDFFPEFGEGEEDVSEASLDKTKKHRYRWPDQIRDVVVAKVLELNRQRALEEGQLLLDDAATTTVTKLKKAPGKKSNAKTPEPTATPTLFAKSAGEV